MDTYIPLELLASVTKVALPALIDLIRKRAAEVESAERKYNEKDSALESSFEIRRRALINDAKQLRTRVLLELPMFENQVKLLSLIYDTLEVLYSAGNETLFQPVEFNLSLIQANLKNYAVWKSRQTTAKWIASIVSIIAIVVVGVVVVFIGRDAPKFDAVTPIPVLQIPWAILIWSFIGSMTAILYRFNIQKDIETQDPYRWLFTRPITGVVMGMVVYLSLRAGLIALKTDSNVNIGEFELTWLAAFIAGFSDKLADTLLKLLVGRFGGDGSDAPLSLINSSSGFSLIESIQSIRSSRDPANKKESEAESTNTKLSKPSTSEQTSPEAPANESIGK